MKLFFKVAICFSFISLLGARFLDERLHPHRILQRDETFAERTFSSKTLSRITAKENSLISSETSSRFSYLQLNADLFSQVRSTKTQILDRLNVALFEDLEVDLIKKKIITHQNGMITWIGHIPEDPWSRAIFTFDSNGIVGNLNVSGRIYNIGQLGEGLHYVSEGVRSRIAADEPESPPKPPKTSTEYAAADTHNNGSYVDLLVIYTADALTAEPTIETEITNAVEYVNDSLARSCGLFRLRLVHTQQVVYDESLSNTDLLTCMATEGDGCLDIVDTLRATHGADIVSMWQASPIAIGYIANQGESNPMAGFNAISPGSGITAMTFAHEIGHNFGIYHDRYSEDKSLNDYQDEFGTAYAYVDTINSFSTHVARGGSCGEADLNCFISGYFSNPRILKNGAPLGKGGIADSVTTLNSMGIHLGNYSQSITEYTPDLSGCEEDAKSASSVPQCFISTAAYGSPLHPYVLDLRSFRDRVLNRSELGRSIVSFYYWASPELAKSISQSFVLKVVSRFFLAPVVFAIVDPLKASFLVFGILFLVFAPYRKLKKYA